MRKHKGQKDRIKWLAVTVKRNDIVAAGRKNQHVLLIRARMS